MHAGPIPRDAEREVAAVAEARDDAADGGRRGDADGEEGAGVGFEEGGADGVGGGVGGVGDVEGAEGVG